MNNIIEGMNVLDKTPIKDYTTLSDVFTVLGLFIAIIATVVLVVKRIDKNEIDYTTIKILLFCYVLGIVMSIFSTIRFPWFYVETGRYIYKCKLENNISTNYISNNFNVISVEDGIWTIEDK